MLESFKSAFPREPVPIFTSGGGRNNYTFRGENFKGVAAGWGGFREATRRGLATGSLQSPPLKEFFSDFRVECNPAYWLGSHPHLGGQINRT